MPSRSRTLEPFDYALVRDPLKELLQTVDEQLKREVPAHVEDRATGLSVCLRVWFRLARQTFDALVTLCANKAGEGELPRPEYVLVVPPLNRSILDTVISTVFLLEDMAGRWSWFMKAGWRQSKEEVARLEADFGTLPSVKEWLADAKRLIDSGPKILGLSPDETEDPRRLKSWPNPGRMVRHGDDRPTRTFLQRLDNLFYVDLSQQAHVSYLGVMKRGYLLEGDGDSDDRRERLKGYASDQVFTAITLMLSLCSVLDERFQLGREGKIRYLWSVVGESWEPAKILQGMRYAQPLFPRGGGTAEVAPRKPLVLLPEGERLS